MLLDEADGEAKPVSLPLRSTSTGTSEPRERQSGSAESYESDFESEHSHSPSQSSAREPQRRASPPSSERSYRSDTFEDDKENGRAGAAASGGDARRWSRDRELQPQERPTASSVGGQRHRSSSPTVSPSASVSHTSASASLRVGVGRDNKCVQVDLSATAVGVGVGVNVTHPLAITNELRDVLVARLLESLNLNPALLATASASAPTSSYRAPGVPLFQPIAPLLDPSTLRGLFVPVSISIQYL